MPAEQEPSSESTVQGSSSVPTQEVLKEQLTPIQYHVTQEKGTERPGTGQYWRFFEDGIYQCICCGQQLFASDSKFPTDCGWPGFDRAISNRAIDTETDYSHNMVRTEVTCSRCGAHLGHVFNDGPTATGLRYCMNSASLKFVADRAKPSDEAAADAAAETSQAPSDLDQQ